MAAANNPIQPTTTSTITTTHSQAAAPQSSGLVNLPSELLVKILGMLSIMEFGSLNQTCHQISSVTTNTAPFHLLSHFFPNFRKTDPDQTDLEALKQGHFINSNLTKGVYASHTLEGHHYSVISLALDGQRLVSSSHDNTIKIWDLTTNTCTATLEGHSGSVYTLAVQGKRLISASHDNTFKVWDLKTNTCTATLEGQSGSVTDLALDGHRLFSGSYDNTIQIWDLNTNTCTATLRGFSNSERLVLGGQRLFSCPFDSTIKIWDFDVPDEDVFKEIAELMTSADRSIARDAMARFDRMPTEAKNAIYQELHEIIGSSANDDGKDAFHNQNGQSSTPAQRAEAIFNYLAKRS
ncbi:MAG: WD40 repeat domain-containing protein [Verrucomicrobia bacterium]|nr:WD40 repeat domain-containing protein [Verrucomicrobiota bacterium]